MCLKHILRGQKPVNMVIAAMVMAAMVMAAMVIWLQW